MALTTRKKRPLDRIVGQLRDTRLIIIATEGRCTEAQYFAMYRSSRVQVKILSTGDDNQSAPEHVLLRLRAFRDQYQLAGDDELWLMVDVDRWGEKQLALVAQNATHCGFGLAVSNPCFEVWLLYHFADSIPATDKCADVERELRRALGGSYSKNKLLESDFSPFVREAAARSEAGDPDPRGRWPSAAGTHVYRVINKLPIDVMVDESR